MGAGTHWSWNSRETRNDEIALSAFSYWPYWLYQISINLVLLFSAFSLSILSQQLLTTPNLSVSLMPASPLEWWSYHIMSSHFSRSRIISFLSTSHLAHILMLPLSDWLFELLLTTWSFKIGSTILSGWHPYTGSVKLASGKRYLGEGVSIGFS